LARIGWQRASLILVQNPETRNWLPSSTRARTAVFPNAVVESEVRLSRPREGEPLTALFAGRLLAWKGAAFAIQAIALLPQWRLIVCGDGPEEGRLRKLASRLGMMDRVEFRGWQPREDLLRTMREEMDVMVFPSLHDEGPWVVAEAVASGRPVVCFDRGGPPVLGGQAVRTTSPAATVEALARAIENAGSSSADAPHPRDFSSRRDELVSLLTETRLFPKPNAGSPDEYGRRA